MDELCEMCDLSDGRNFIILNEEIVHVICNEHIQYYGELYCPDCELFHIEPSNPEYCKPAMQIFMMWNTAPEEDSMEDLSQNSGIPEID